MRQFSQWPRATNYESLVIPVLNMQGSTVMFAIKEKNARASYPFRIKLAYYDIWTVVKRLHFGEV